MFENVEDVVRRFKEERYIADKALATVVFLATKLEKPLLVEGPAGVGKTDLAKVLARSLGRELIRLQCYEGLDESKALYEWEYAKQLLYTQILRDKIGEIVADAKTLRDAVDRVAAEDDVFFSPRFLLPRPLLQAIRSDEPRVLLIDEIDKSDPEFEAFLLEVLSDFQVTVPEIGTMTARHVPLVVLTSNSVREISDALKRRCLHLHLDYPTRDRELEIVRLKVPEMEEGLARQVVEAVQVLRDLDLKKTPSISETLDWARALLLLNVDSLDDGFVEESLSAILKHDADLRKARLELRNHVERQKAVAVEAEADPDEDVLH